MKRKIRLIVLTLLIILGSLWGYFFFFQEKINFKTNKINPDQISNIVEANNYFALDYYSYLKNKEEGNIFFSPFSISNALVLVYEGADGQTAEEIRNVFYFPQDNEQRHYQYQETLTNLNNHQNDYQLKIANALWLQEGYPFQENYLTNTKNFYQGKNYNLNFKQAPEEAKNTINDWVASQTNNKIKDIIDRLDELTRLVLTNAIYFKGQWSLPFREESTQAEDFKTKNGNVSVPMMRQTDYFAYTENRLLQMIKLPYQGGDLSMLILLPKNDNLEKLEKSLNLTNLTKWQNDLETKEVEVFLPRFSFETKYLMKEDLIALGMPSAFDPQKANLGKIVQDEENLLPLCISEVIHQTFIEVDEVGTEAAAATIVAVAEMSALNQKTEKIYTFRADHPFIFLIQENKTGNILFIGRVTSPLS